MKERVVVFSDAIIAIILTIMVLELPINFLTNGSIDFISLTKSIGIYFISFCFVANIWFQTATAFNKINQVKNKTLVAYILLLFLLSLVPAVTRVLIEDTNRQTVVLYGVVTFLVLLVMNRVIVSLTKQMDYHKNELPFRINELNRQGLFNFFFRILLIIFSNFFITISLVIYLILPILEFLRNIIDQEENSLVTSLDTIDQKEYFTNRNQFWGNASNRYKMLLKDSLRNDTHDRVMEKNRMIQEWQNNIDKEIAKMESKLENSTPQEKSKYEAKLRLLQAQKDRLNHSQDKRNQERH